MTRGRRCTRIKTNCPVGTKRRRPRINGCLVSITILYKIYFVCVCSIIIYLRRVSSHRAAPPIARYGGCDGRNERRGAPAEPLPRSVWNIITTTNGVRSNAVAVPVKYPKCHLTTTEVHVVSVDHNNIVCVSRNNRAAQFFQISLMR